MNNDNKKTRREFLGDVLWKGSLVAMGGLVSLASSREACAVSREYQQTLSYMSQIDPKMILYEEIDEPIHTGLADARALNVDSSGMLYVSGDQAINVINPNGRIKDTRMLTFAPRCLASSEEQLYIGTRDRIVITDRNGKVQVTWPSLGDNAWITSIALDEENIYIADAGQRIVWCFDRKGRFIRRIGDKDPEKEIPGFVVPGPYFDLGMAPDGLLRVANPGRHQIEAYTIKGDRELAWGKFGNNLDDFTACCNPVSFAIMADGSVVTCEKGLARVKVYDANGMLTGVVAGPQELTAVAQSISAKPEQRQYYGFDVAVDTAGHVYVLDRVRNFVRIFTRKEAYRS